MALKSRLEVWLTFSRVYPDYVNPLGWIVTYIIDIRGGGPSTGYVSSGFFGGEINHANRAVEFANVIRPHIGPCAFAVGQQEGTPAPLVVRL